MEDWPGEKWLDISKINELQPIMSARMTMAKENGCDAVDPDNVDGYTNNTGFNLNGNDQINYNKMLSQVAHSLGLAIGLKNDVDQIGQLVDFFDFAAGAHHGGLAPERNREHSIGNQVDGWNVGMMDPLL